MTMIDATRTTKLAEIEGELVLINAETKRLPYVVSNGLYPSAWDDHHERLNELLDQWENAKVAL